MQRPTDVISPEHREMIGKIDALAQDYRLQRQSRLITTAADAMTSWSEAISSCRIEGIPSEIEQLFLPPIEADPKIVQESADAKSARAAANCLEAETYLKGTRWHPATMNDRPTIEHIWTAHRFVMNGLLDPSQLGIWRGTDAEIAREGKIVDTCPPHREIPEMMRNLDTYLKSAKDHPVIAAGMAHGFIELIHPFIEGNGRIGRAVANAVSIAGNVPAWPVSKIILENRPRYYQCILDASSANSPAPYIPYHIEATLHAGKHALDLTIQLDKYMGDVGRAISLEDVRNKNKILTFLATHPMIDSRTAADKADVPAKAMALALTGMSNQKLLHDFQHQDVDYLVQTRFMGIIKTPYARSPDTIDRQHSTRAVITR